MRPPAASPRSHYTGLHSSDGAAGGITKAITWHVFRHPFSKLLAGNDEYVNTLQSLMRHANSNMIMNICALAGSSKKRRA